MQAFDRLTTLINRFRLTVRPTASARAGLTILCDENGRPVHLCFSPRGEPAPIRNGTVLFQADVDWSGQSNPLLAALPRLVDIDLACDPECRGLVELMQAELTGNRCGASSVISRLGEVLIVRLLRRLIETGTTQTGLLAGLADPRISRAIVAIHDQPGKPWSNQDLAEIAGLSRSRFADMFLALVGETPAAYLRRWRLTLARQDVERGDRIDAVARRYGYGSAEGFSRAFRKQFGDKPIAARSQAA